MLIFQSMKKLKKTVLAVARRTLTLKHIMLVMSGERLTIKTKNIFYIYVKKSNHCGWNYIVLTARDQRNNLLGEVEVQPSYFGLPLFT